MRTAHLKIPALVGSRSRATELAQACDDQTNLQNMQVTLDFSDNESAAQGFCNQLVKDMVSLKVSSIVLDHTNDRVTNFVVEAAQIYLDREDVSDFIKSV